MKNLMRFLALFIISFVAVLNAQQYKYQLAVCAIFKNEARFLKEWIEFNILVGVEHFYLYNNDSTDNCEEILEPYIKKGLVDCIHWSPIRSLTRYPAQVGVYTHCLNQVRGSVKWLMCIDLDEFVFPVECDDLREFLKDYEDYAAVCANWVMFGTSHVKKIPTKKLLIESLVMRASLDLSRNKTIKSIVQPEKVLEMGVHRPAQMFPGYFQVTTDKQRFEGKKSPVFVIDKLRINHYWTKDEQFLYDVKLPRLMSKYEEKWKRRLESKSFIQMMDKLNREKDATIFKYVKCLRKKMFGN